VVQGPLLARTPARESGRTHSVWCKKATDQVGLPPSTLIIAIRKVASHHRTHREPPTIRSSSVSQLSVTSANLSESNHCAPQQPPAIGERLRGQQ